MQNSLCLYSYHAHFILSLNQKNMLQKEIKDWAFQAYLLTKETSSWFQLIGSWKMTCARSTWTASPSLAASLEPLAHQNVANLSLFYMYYFGRCSSELVLLVPLPFSQGRSTRYWDRWHNFSVTMPRYYKDVYVNRFFPHTVRLWNSVPIECFPLTYNLNDFTSSINRHLLTKGLFLKRFSVCFDLFVHLFLETPCLAVAVQPGIEWIPKKKKVRLSIVRILVQSTMLIFLLCMKKLILTKIWLKFCKCFCRILRECIVPAFLYTDIKFRYF